ncbi:YdcF family protein [Parendozoicomonas sp. Alg238-R29]|uniref:YdcF family protein n=1 Tax=Parendozoicomonas sp. Alg238-R29 TaxID=2993446 RepID=UPI00248DDC50|nr:YdcF family protein [Parendozoicomonas sp. Alg238-R29]
MLKSLLQPPGIQLVILLIALLCWFRFRYLSFALVLISCTSLYLLSTAAVSNALMKGLETEKVFHFISGQEKADAIVILGTGVLGNTPEYEMTPQPGPLLLQRLRYGLMLHTETGLPLLVSGGSRYGINEARVMKTFLENHGATVQWLDSSSRTTRENAEHSADILKQYNAQRILLVSHAWHLPRAKSVFEQVGFTVIAAPTAQASTQLSVMSLEAWLPNVRYLRKSQLALHEYAGMFWYRISS